MKNRNLDWIILSGPRTSNPDIRYFIGQAHISHPILIKKLNNENIIIYNSIERGEIERFGLSGIDTEDILSRNTIKTASSQLDKTIMFYGEIFKRFDIKGRGAFYGIDNIHKFFILQREIIKEFQDIKIIESFGNDIFQNIRETKDNCEIKFIRDVVKRTCHIFERIGEFFKSKKRKSGFLINENNEKITIGDLRRFVHIEFAKNDLTPVETQIISMGYDAAIPHSAGNDASDIEEGKTIVLDIFPRCIKTGYYADITRTICIGRAPEKTREIYENVKKAQEIAIGQINAGCSISRPVNAVIDYFEEKKYPTQRKTPRTISGFAHSLGHGLGLELHEKPAMSLFNENADEDVFKPGMVFTIEPGLYFPDEEIGIRLEDVCIINEKGEIEVLSQLPKVFEIFPEEIK